MLCLARQGRGFLTRISVFLSEKQLSVVRQFAQDAGVSMAEMLRRLLDNALRQEQAQRKEQR